jgi:hypothetical protein
MSRMDTAHGVGTNREQDQPAPVRPPDALARLEAIERRLQALHESVVALEATNHQLVEELAMLRQGQSSHSEAVTKLEREVRRGRWLRRLGALFRLLIWLAILGALLYFLGDWVNWQGFFQLFV